MATTALADVVEIVMGQAPPGNACNKDGVGTPFVKAGEFQDRRPVIREWTTKPLRMAQYDDTLVCVVGATAGKVNQGADCAIGRSVAAVRPRSDYIDPEFLYRFLSTTVTRLRGGSQGAAQGVITRDMIGSLVLNLPPLPEQRRIAAILDHADALRTRRRKVLAHLDALITSIFDSLFSGDLPTASLGELAETRLGKMLDAKKQTGEHRRPYLRNANVQWFRFELEDLLEMDFTEKDRATFALLPGDVLVCEGGQPGRSAIWRGELDECYFQKALHRVRLGDELEPEYFTHAMKKIVDSNGLKDFVTSSTIAHLTGEKLRTLPIPLPDLPRQREFAARVAQIRRQTEAVTRTAATADDLFGSLEFRAFRGEL